MCSMLILAVCSILSIHGKVLHMLEMCYLTYVFSVRTLDV